MKVEGTTVHIELDVFVEQLDDKARRVLGQLVVADEQLFGAVLDAVVTGEFFADDEDRWWFSFEAMAELRQKLLPLMPEIAAQLIKELVHQRDQEKLLRNRADRWAWKLYHAWPDEYWTARPSEDRDFPHAGWPSLDEVREEIRRRGLFGDKEQD